MLTSEVHHSNGVDGMKRIRERSLERLETEQMKRYDDAFLARNHRDGVGKRRKEGWIDS